MPPSAGSEPFDMTVCTFLMCTGMPAASASVASVMSTASCSAPASSTNVAVLCC